MTPPFAATYTVAQHFSRSEPSVREIYDRLLDVARTLGPVTEDPKKTSIHLNRRTAFAGVATRKDALVLTLKAREDIHDPRIRRREKVSANRWHLEVRLERPAEVDRQLATWLGDAYALAG